jgi:hypothetical protein
MIINGKSGSRIKIRAKNINVLQFTLGILSGTAIYFNLYFILRQYILNLNKNINILSLFQVFYIQSFLVLVLIIIVWKFPVKKSEIL